MRKFLTPFATRRLPVRSRSAPHLYRFEFVRNEKPRRKRRVRGRPCEAAVYRKRQNICPRWAVARAGTDSLNHHAAFFFYCNFLPTNYIGDSAERKPLRPAIVQRKRATSGTALFRKSPATGMLPWCSGRTHPVLAIYATFWWAESPTRTTIRMRRTTPLCAAVDPAIAQRQAGHSDYRTTQRHYIDPRIARGRCAADILPDPANPSESKPRFRVVG